MEWTCLIVDLVGGEDSDALREQVESVDFAMPVSLADSLTEADAMLAGGSVLTMAVISPSADADTQSVLKSFQRNVGCLPDFQAIICSEPEPAYLAAVFEYGIETFMSREQWHQELPALNRNALKLMADEESAEARTVHLTRSIRSADQQKISEAKDALGDLAEYDYRAAFAKGKACEATGDYSGAADVYRDSSSMNKLFRPGTSSLGETLLVTGKVDEALEVFKKLEKTNPYDVERKANIAAAYVEKGDFDTAMKYVGAAEKLGASNSRVLEAKAQVLLCTGKVGDAFKLMDGMSEVGPFFAAKLNELGIKLSQAGKGKSALALYQKAHKIVRPELRYKISINAALACRRLKAWDMALKYLARCEREYGQSFPKLEKIRESVNSSKTKDAAARKAG